jgi:hypothetical protein
VAKQHPSPGSNQNGKQKTRGNITMWIKNSSDWQKEKTLQYIPEFQFRSCEFRPRKVKKRLISQTTMSGFGGISSPVFLK